jgi:hypothetical protein
LSRNALITITIIGLILLNALTLAEAIPETRVIDGGCCSSSLLAKDFSAYYVGAWRLVNDPGELYTRGVVNDGGPATPPKPESYKYMPSFLLLIIPFLSLTYQDALLAFDLLQFLLLPIIAALLWWLLRREKPLYIGIALLLVLLQPFPLPHWGLSASYYWQWAEGQAKVLETLLLLLSFFLGESGRPKLSGVAFAFASFDPRFALLGFPLFLLFNRRRLKASVGSAFLSLVVINLPLFYPPTLEGFLAMSFSYGATTPLYFYSFIPLAALAILYVAHRAELASALRSIGGKETGAGGVPS